MSEGKPLTEPQRLVLAEITRMRKPTTADLRMRRDMLDWDFDPRNVARGLARRGLVEQVWNATIDQAQWILREA